MGASVRPEVEWFLSNFVAKVRALEASSDARIRYVMRLCYRSRSRKNQRVLATRNPYKFHASEGRAALRKAELNDPGSLIQSPPRKTRLAQGPLCQGAPSFGAPSYPVCQQSKVHSLTFPNVS